MFDRKGFPPALKVGVLFFVSPDAGTFVFFEIIFCGGKFESDFPEYF